jgi:GxxExxY protein
MNGENGSPEPATALNAVAYPHQSATREIIGAAYAFHRQLGGGFLEKVYENALAIELGTRGLQVRQQAAVAVQYKGAVVGDYVCDLLVSDNVLCEVKALEALVAAHHAQLLNYLKGTGLKVGLLVNFGPKRVDIKRIVN